MRRHPARPGTRPALQRGGVASDGARFPAAIASPAHPPSRARVPAWGDRFDGFPDRPLQRRRWQSQFWSSGGEIDLLPDRVLQKNDWW